MSPSGPHTAPRPAALMGRGLRLRCPACGVGKPFTGFFTMRERCEVCGLRFERIEGHWVGALGINTIVSFGTLFAVLFSGVVATWPDLPVVPLTVAGAMVAVLVPVLFFPWSRTLWTAIDIWMRPLEPDELVSPASTVPHDAGRDDAADDDGSA